MEQPRRRRQRDAEAVAWCEPGVYTGGQVACERHRREDAEHVGLNIWGAVEYQRERKNGTGNGGDPKLPRQLTYRLSWFCGRRGEQGRAGYYKPTAISPLAPCIVASNPSPPALSRRSEAGSGTAFGAIAVMLSTARRNDRRSEKTVRHASRAREALLRETPSVEKADLPAAVS